MNLAIVRTANGPLDINGYNVQEIGLAKGLIKLGFNVDIYSTFKGIYSSRILLENDKNRIKIIPLKGYAYKQITLYPGLFGNLFDQNYEFLQLHDDSQLMGPFLAAEARKRGIKVVLYQGMYTDYSGLAKIYQSLFDTFFKRTFQKNLDVVFSKTTKAKLYLENKGYQNINLLPVGLNIQEEKSYKNQDELNRFTTKFDRTLLYIGKIEPRRDLAFLLDVFENLITKEKLNVGFVIIGQGPDKLKIQNLVIELGLEENVFFINRVPNDQVGAVYKNCDLFVLPSHYEIYGMVVLEALYYGLPVISSKTAGPLDIIKENYLGALVNFQFNEWLNVLSTYLKSDFLTTKYSKQREQYVVSKYNWDYIAQTYINYL